MDNRFVTVFTRIVGVVTIVLIAALGLLWMRDRARPRSEPRWEPFRFVALHEPAPVPRERQPTWVYVVNPQCPHCREALPDAERAVRASRERARFAILIVDTPEQPAESEVESYGAEEVWWDTGAVWRERWGHRLYGELLVFDRDGRLLETRSPRRLGG